MRRRWQAWAGQGALIALLLQLALPFLSVQTAIASPAGGAPFVICTGSGLVWITPEGAPAEGEPPEDDRHIDHYCPICSTKQLGSAALLPTAASILPAAPYVRIARQPTVLPPPLVRSAPPLPARGPPVVS